MGLCVLYYIEYSLYNVKKVGFFYLGWNYTLIPHFETVPNSKKLQMITEMWLLKHFKGGYLGFSHLTELKK